jgi:hypothetical protein
MRVKAGSGSALKPMQIHNNDVGKASYLFVGGGDDIRVGFFNDGCLPIHFTGQHYVALIRIFVDGQIKNNLDDYSRLMTSLHNISFD